MLDSLWLIILFNNFLCLLMLLFNALLGLLIDLFDGSIRIFVSLFYLFVLLIHLLRNFLCDFALLKAFELELLSLKLGLIDLLQCLLLLSLLFLL